MRNKTPLAPETELEQEAQTMEVEQPTTRQRQSKEPEQPKAYTKPGYKVGEGEENDVHVKLSREIITKVGGRTKVEEKEMVHIVDPKMWRECRKIWPSQGWLFVEMCHTPVGCESGFPEPETKAD